VGKPLSANKRRRAATPPANDTRLWLIRHAEVERRYQKTFGGRIDMDLSPRGRTQARTLAEHLCDKTFDAVYASPMKRVQQTLAPALKAGLPAPAILPGLREVDFGDWTGHDWFAVQKKFGVHPYDWLHEITRGTVPRGESAIDFRARVEPCLFTILDEHPGGNVAVFCHGGVIRMILSILLDLPLPKTNSFDIEYTSITRVVLRPHLNEVELLNFPPWRDATP
jgi:broad specificity phosphatase PhoE